MQTDTAGAATPPPSVTDDTTRADPAIQPNADLEQVRQDYEARLIAATLKIEAVKSGMIDLDGLKLVDLRGVRLDHNDRIVGGEGLMAELRRDKPWLFAPAFSSSTAAAPASQPVRSKKAIDMTDEE